MILEGCDKPFKRGRIEDIHLLVCVVCWNGLMWVPHTFEPGHFQTYLEGLGEVLVTIYLVFYHGSLLAPV
jgi:hypothetical protein